MALAAALSLLTVSSAAHAISRYTSTAMSCANIRTTTQAEGAAIFRWLQPPDIHRYMRLVANTSYCLWGEIATPVPIPSADTKDCVVFECQRPVVDEDFHFSIIP